MSSVIKHYRDPQTGHRYTIEFRPEADGTWTLWALDAPKNAHGGSVTEHHLYSSGQVCVDARHKPRTLDRAVAIAVYWMNRYSAFVTTGTFPRTPGRVNV